MFTVLKNFLAPEPNFWWATWSTICWLQSHIFSGLFGLFGAHSPHISHNRQTFMMWALTECVGVRQTSMYRKARLNRSRTSLTRLVGLAMLDARWRSFCFSGLAFLSARGICWISSPQVFRTLRSSAACFPRGSASSAQKPASAAPPATQGAGVRKTRASRRGPRRAPRFGPRGTQGPAGNTVQEARKKAPPAPAFAPELVRPEAINVEELRLRKDVLLLEGSFDLAQVVQWISDGGCALVMGRWHDLERCRAAVLKPLRKAPSNAKEAEKTRTLKKQLSDRVLGLVARGRIALRGAPRADFLQTLRPCCETQKSADVFVKL